MTKTEIQAAVHAIELVADDPERAHGEEDELHQAVLAAIVSGDLDCTPAEAAEEALKTTRLAFARWCA